MIPRTRTRSEYTPGGTISAGWLGETPTIIRSDPVLTKVSRCEDEWKKTVGHAVAKPGDPYHVGIRPLAHGKKLLPPSPCFIRHSEFLQGRTSGAGNGPIRSVDQIISAMTASAPYADQQLVAKISARDLGTPQYLQRLLSRTNPDRAEFSVFVFVRELLEVLSMFVLGPVHSLAGFLGKTYLNYRFGWSTFIQDITTLDGIVKSVHSRFREILTMAEHGGLYRKIGLDSFSINSSVGNYPVHSAPNMVFRTNVHHAVKRKVHATIRWQLTPWYTEFLRDLKPLEAWDLAIRKVFSLESPTILDVWNIIPFSWLLDYFYDVNTYLESTWQEQLMEPIECCLIRRTEIDITSDSVTTNAIAGHGQFTASPGHKRVTEYRRDILNPRGISPLVSMAPSIRQNAAMLALAAVFRDRRIGNRNKEILGS